MYWTDVQTFKIQRANLDGTNVQDLVVTSLIRPDGIALDIAGGKMYWTATAWAPAPPLNKIQRANLDGTDVEDLLVNVGAGEGIAVDSVGRKMYWVNNSDDKIQRANLDGTNIEDLITTGLDAPIGITLDVAGGKMYWTDRGTDKIQRANLDGTNIEDLITTGLIAPINIALDLMDSKMYWTDWEADKIQRANLDGTNIEDLITTGLVGPDGIALHLTTGKMYWADWGTAKIRRANLDGTDIEDLVTTGLRGSAGIALGIPEPIGPLTFNPSEIADQTFTVGTPVSLTLPSVTGGTAPYTYTLEPLPEGLVFDSATQNLTGTPTTAVNAHPVTYTATNATGASASLTFSITVQDTPSLGHTSWVWNVAFSPDGTTIASALGGRDAPVRLWDAATGTALRTLIGHTGWGAYSVAFSPDGTTIASGGQDETVRLWDAATGTSLRTLNGHAWSVYSVAFSPDGTTIASGGDETVRLWDAATGTALRTLIGHREGVYSVAFSPDGRTIASGSWDGTVRLWDAATGTALRTLIGHREGAAISVAYSPDGRTIASGSWDAPVRLWDAATGTALRTLNGHRDGILSVAYSPDGRTIASGGHDETVRLWDAATGTALRTLNGHMEQVNSVAFSPDGTTIASGSGDGTVLLWELTPPSPTIIFTPDSIPDQTFTVGTAVSLTLPTTTGGTAPYTYTLSPIPAGLQFDAATRVLSGTPTTATPATPVTYTATDATGAFATLTFTITVTGGANNLDVNGDGQLNVLDLILVAVFYGTRGDNIPADVNADGIVNVLDFAAVAEGVDAAGALPLQAVEAALLAAAAQAGDIEAIAGAPLSFDARQNAWFKKVAYHNVAAALSDVRHLATSDPRLGKTVALLAELLQLLKEMNAIPETTALLPNYPNPFNPETWIPYHLAKDANVTLTIYSSQGVAVRQLMLGHQPAGIYESRGRASYWDGRNQVGEPVASGLYFYTLTAGDFTATRKLFITK